MLSSRYFLFTLTLSVLLELNATDTDEEINKIDIGKIEWTEMEHALNGELVKPIFVFIHKSWCKACINLKNSLDQSPKFKELSELFHMISYEVKLSKVFYQKFSYDLKDDKEPKDKSYTPDGNYIPRIFFLNSSGGVHYDIYNENGNSKYKYFYSNANQVVRSMEKAIEIFYTNEENNNEITDYENLEDDYESGLDEDLSLSDEDESAFLHEDL